MFPAVSPYNRAQRTEVRLDNCGALSKGSQSRLHRDHRRGVRIECQQASVRCAALQDPRGVSTTAGRGIHIVATRPRIEAGQHLLVQHGDVLTTAHRLLWRATVYAIVDHVQWQ